ncbi:MAG: SulP family inorganic anion transporter, partial [Bacteroidetes bacterium]|nr:SulP family inorganic anion transporter [Bacteroidota bacterium]
GWEQFVPFIVTVVAIQFSGLLKGIAGGMIVAAFIILRNNFKLAYFYHKEEKDGVDKIIIQLAEDVSFLNKGSIALTLDEFPEGSHVIIDGSKSRNIDMDVLEIIHDFKNNTAVLKKINIDLKNIPDFNGVSGH